MYGCYPKLRYVKKRNRYENSTHSLVYYPDTFNSFSYGHWVLSKLVNDGKAILVNTYRYSHTTANHIQGILDRLKVDTKLPIIEVDCYMNIRENSFEIDYYSASYEDMIMHKFILENKELPRLYRLRHEKALAHLITRVEDLRKRFKYIKTLRKEEPALEQLAEATAKKTIADYIIQFKDSNKARREHYWYIVTNENQPWHATDEIKEHPFFEAKPNGTFVERKRFYVAKKDFKDIVRAIKNNRFSLAHYTFYRTSVAKVPKWGKLITKEDVPNLRTKVVKDEIRSVMI